MVRGPARTKEPCPCQSLWRGARAAHASVPLPAPGQGTVVARLPGLLRENGGQPGAIGTFLPGLGRGSQREAPLHRDSCSEEYGLGAAGDMWGGGGSAVCLGPASLRPITRACKWVWVSLGKTHASACRCMCVSRRLHACMSLPVSMHLRACVCECRHTSGSQTRPSENVWSVSLLINP